MEMGWLLEFATEGFLAFATGLLLLSYLLLRKIIASKDNDGKNLLIRCNMIQKFMAASIFVIIMGMVSEYLNPKIIIKFDVSPKDTEGLVVKVGGEEINITSSDDINIRDRYEISLDLVKLDRKLRDLSSSLSYTEDVLKGLKNELAILKKHQVKEYRKSISSEEEGI